MNVSNDFAAHSLNTQTREMEFKSITDTTNTHTHNALLIHRTRQASLLFTISKNQTHFDHAHE